MGGVNRWKRRNKPRASLEGAVKTPGKKKKKRLQLKN